LIKTTARSLVLALLAAAAPGCSSDAPSGSDAGALDGAPLAGDGGFPYGPDATEPDPGGGMTFQCDNLPPLPWAFRAQQGPPPSEDFTFDNDGYLLALSSNNLVRLAHGGTPQLVAANVAIVGTGVRVLANGDIAVADEVRGAVVRISASGDRTNVGANIRSPNGLQLGPGGNLFLTDRTGGNLYRIDPAANTTTLLSFIVEGVDGLVFSNDFRTLFVGSYDSGEVFRITINDDGTAQPPVRFAEGLNGADGMTIDECGNLYVAGFRDGTLKRVSPDGKVELVAALATRSASAVNFGSGRQGWDARTIYVMNYADGGVFEVRAGVRGAPPPPGRAP
jgi:hypothetical protein